MRWIKIHGNMLSDDRLQLLFKEQRFAGIGLYFFVLLLVECQGEGAIAYGQLEGAIPNFTSRNRLLKLICDYNLFVRIETGLILSVDPIPGYMPEEMKKLRHLDITDAVSRARVSVRSGVPARAKKRRIEKNRVEKSAEHYQSLDSVITNDQMQGLIMPIPYRLQRHLFFEKHGQ